VACELQRISASELRALSPGNRRELLSKPTVVTGLIDDWPALSTWAHPANFSRRFGHHKILARRVSFGYGQADRVDADKNTAEMKFDQVVARAASEHMVMLDESTGTRGEAALQLDLTHDYTVPDLMESASQLRVWSFGGGGRGVQMMKHMVAWLATVAGAKLWHLAHPDLPQPSDRSCANHGAVDHQLAKEEGVSHCLVLPGEVMVVPDFWWHATCNLLPYTVAIGGQLWVPPSPSRAAFDPRPPPRADQTGTDAPRTRPLNEYQRSIQGDLLESVPLPSGGHTAAWPREKDEL
jgi:hypothetical protein